MRTFLSWSGERSRIVAEHLKGWLADVFENDIEPWLSTVDIDAGTRWEEALAGQLADSSFAIMCVTEENRRSPWLLFEAGAISNADLLGSRGRGTKRTRKRANNRVVPYLIGVSPTSLPSPLRQFQVAEATKEGTRKLVDTLNASLVEMPRAAEHVRRRFDQRWPSIEKVLTSLPPAPSAEDPNLPEELTLAFSGRRERVGDTQERLLRRLVRHTRQPRSSIEQEDLRRDFIRKYPEENPSGSEFYYRLEQLRLMGFVMKEPIPGTRSHRYHLSPAFRQEIARKAEADPSE